MAHSGESKVWICRGCGAGAGALRSEAEGAVHVLARHAARCTCGAVLSAQRSRPRGYRCPVPACTDTFAVQYLLERHLQAHHTMPQPVSIFLKVSMVVTFKTLLPSEVAYFIQICIWPVLRSTKGATKGPNRKKGSSKSVHKWLVRNTQKTLRRTESLFSSQLNILNHFQGLNGDIGRSKRVENNNAPEGADGACSPCNVGAESNGAVAPNTDERRRKNGAVALQCAYCGERTRSRAELEAHTRAHSGAAAARHKCLICDEVLPSAAVLAEHKLTHCKVS